MGGERRGRGAWNVALTLLSVAAIMPLAACARFDIDRQTEASAVVGGDGREFDFLLYLPAEYHDTLEPWPILFMLHGIFESGDDLRILPKYGPAREIEAGRQFPFIVVTPQIFGAAWDPARTVALIEHCLAQYRVDRRKVYLSGFSIGGRGVWAIAAHRPDLFAALVPVSGWGRQAEAQALAGVPVWAFHGSRDVLVPAAASRRMIAWHGAAGGTSELTMFDGAGHEIWDRVYPETFIYDWLLAQQKREPIPPGR